MEADVFDLGFLGIGEPALAAIDEVAAPPGLDAPWLTSAGRGRIIVDSGAAESVMPRGMLPREILRQGVAARVGVRYVAANCANMEIYGGTRVRFWHESVPGGGGITFRSPTWRSPLRL